jgi:hypothetical protein
MRLLLLVDRDSPLELVDRELVSLRSWISQYGLTSVAVEVIVFGRAASWLPEGVTLASSAVAGNVGATSTPNLAAAFRLADSRPPHAVGVLLASEPQVGWLAAVRSAPPFRAAIGSRVVAQPPSNTTPWQRSASSGDILGKLCVRMCLRC